MDTLYDIIGRKPIHPFPARMAPSIALEALAQGAKNKRILDPMCGSGTVLAVARAKGHRGYGIDCDPLSVLNTSVWTVSIDRARVIDSARKVLIRAKTHFANAKIEDEYPEKADEETRAFMAYWFDATSRRELTALSRSITSLRDIAVQRVLWVAFSRMIITKKSGVSLAMDLSHSRPHKVHLKAPARPFQIFEAAVAHVAENCPTKGIRGSGRNADVRLGDNRDLPFRGGFFDLVITSPPYLNAIDYIRCSKFSLVWMGYSVGDLRNIRRESVGSERSPDDPAIPERIDETVAAMTGACTLTARQRGLLARYVIDMETSVSEVSRVLKTGGRAVYVVGNNQMSNVVVSNSEAVKLLAKKAGLKLEGENTRELPPNQRYLPAPSHNTAGKSLQARMRTEVILKFRRS